MTQADRILDVLRRFGNTTVLDWPAGFRLAARIKDLRDRGYLIDTDTVTLPGGAKVARYTLRTTPTFAPTIGEQERLSL